MKILQRVKQKMGSGKRGLLLAQMIAAVFSSSLAWGNAQAAGDSPIAIAVHGGAGTILKKDLSEEKRAGIKADLQRAVEAGHAVLKKGGTSVDAVQAAILILEDSAYFNAAKGAVLNEDGEVELDASIMQGDDRNAGAIAGVHGVRNPILLARQVMEHSPHVLLAGRGAEQFARQRGIQFEDSAYFKTPFRVEQWERLTKERQTKIHHVRDQLAPVMASSVRPASYPDAWFSTVGAVALDQHGHLAAGTSTGGTALKRWGRIGDSPIIGSGTYAQDGVCAVSATGHGEYFIRASVAHDICARVRHAGMTVKQAADQVVMQDLVDMGGEGGVITVSADGKVAMPFNTAGMYRAAIHADGRLEVAIHRDDES